MRKRDSKKEYTCFQEAAPYVPQTDSRANVAIVYGINDSYEQRVEQWRERGYIVHTMTGISWGDYTDYVRGEWDGTPYYDDAQTDRGGFRLEHGISQGHDIYYMMPSMTYNSYLLEKLKRVVDSGVTAIHLEEPEFWVRSGYSEGFKKEWLACYNEEWTDPSLSRRSRYKCERLKQYLYSRSIRFLCKHLKNYACEKGLPDFCCYVPTHSLVNYAQWRIVSPESNLATMAECDGIIGQTWTGTARTANWYRGIKAQRTFSGAYCEYAATAAMLRGSNKRLWQLADPIEDDPNFCWQDYQSNWEATVVASLLIPESNHFEIMPWPHRIFTRSYPAENLAGKPFDEIVQARQTFLTESGSQDKATVLGRAAGLLTAWFSTRQDSGAAETLGFAAPVEENSEVLSFGKAWSVIEGFYHEIAGLENQAEAQKIRDALSDLYHNAVVQRSAIPASYASSLQVVFNALADMQWPDDSNALAGGCDIGVVISDSLMFQRGEPDPGDPELSSLFGLTLPLLHNGYAFSFLQAENEYPGCGLEDVKILLLTWEGQKPLTAGFHERLRQWLAADPERTLVVFGDGDGYDNIGEWWNSAGYDKPQQQLFELLGVQRNLPKGEFKTQSGNLLIFDPSSPAALAKSATGAAVILHAISRALRQSPDGPATPAALAFRRGPYIAAAIAAGADANSGLEMAGNYIDLFDAELPVLSSPVINRGQHKLLYDLSFHPAEAEVLAAAGRVCDEAKTSGSLAFRIEGQGNTAGIARVRLPHRPAEIKCTADCHSDWHEASRTLFLRFPAAPDGVSFCIRWN